jgi:hypothetical protein
MPALLIEKIILGETPTLTANASRVSPNSTRRATSRDGSTPRKGRGIPAYKTNEDFIATEAPSVRPDGSVGALPLV